MKVLLLFATILIISCNKENHETCKWLKATVLYTGDMNCGLPVLNFTEDSTRLKAFTGEQFSLYFIAKGLPSNLNIQDQKLHVLVTKWKPEDAVACRTIGPHYSGLKVKNAVQRK